MSDLWLLEIVRKSVIVIKDQACGDTSLELCHKLGWSCRKRSKKAVIHVETPVKSTFLFRDKCEIRFTSSRNDIIL